MGVYKVVSSRGRRVYQVVFGKVHDSSITVLHLRSCGVGEYRNSTVFNAC